MGDSTIEIQVKGMTCEHCERAVTAELTEIPAISDVDIDVATGRVLISSSTPLDRDQVERAIADAGYELERWPSGESR